MQRLSGYDAAFLYDERPEEPQHTLKVAIWGEAASAGHSLSGTRRWVRSRLPELPPLRWRALRVPLDLHHPVWVDDPALDLGVHVRGAALDPPGGRHELCEAISRVASCPLDPTRPLWELWMLEGYEGCKVVAVLKMSHALADGGASKRLLERLYGLEPIPSDTGSDESWPGEPLPSRWALVRDALRDRIHEGVCELPRLGRATRRVRRALRRRPVEPLYRGRRVSLLSSPATPFAGPPGRARTFSFATLPLDEAKAVGRALGCTLNDVILATAAGALRGYLRDRGALPGVPILAHMPASIRGEDEQRAWGNRISSRAISLPTHIADPIARLHAASAVAREAKEDLQRRRGADLEDWLRWLPPSAAKGVGRSARLFVRLHPERSGGVTVSSVKGPAQPLHAPGGPIENLVSVGHVKYVAGLNITVWSYVGHLNFGLYACPEAVPDPWHLVDHVGVAFEALRKAAAPLPAG